MLTTAALNQMLTSLVDGTSLALMASENTEVSADGYARKNLTSSLFNVSGGVLTNNDKFYFVECENPNGWGTVTHVAIFNGTTKLYVGQLTSSVTIANNTMAKFPTGAFSITLTSQDS